MWHLRVADTAVGDLARYMRGLTQDHMEDHMEEDLIRNDSRKHENTYGETVCNKCIASHVIISPSAS